MCRILEKKSLRITINVKSQVDSDIAEFFFFKVLVVNENVCHTYSNKKNS